MPLVSADRGRRDAGSRARPAGALGVGRGLGWNGVAGVVGISLYRDMSDL